jgi:hypothetical protein
VICALQDETVTVDKEAQLEWPQNVVGRCIGLNLVVRSKDIIRGAIVNERDSMFSSKIKIALRHSK